MKSHDPGPQGPGVHEDRQSSEEWLPPGARGSQEQTPRQALLECSGSTNFFTPHSDVRREVPL